MRLLLINGSPKGERSNSLRLARAFLKGMGADDAQTLTLSSMQIGHCLGCFSCWSKTPGRCCIHDDMEQALHLYLQADVVIWSFPLYYFSLPGLLKNMLDRMLPLNQPFMSGHEAGGHEGRYDLSHQHHVLVSTCGFYTTKGNYDSVRCLFDRFLGKDKYEELFCAQGELFRVPELRARTDAYLQTVEQAGREYAAGGIRPETRAALDTPLYDRETFERMADSSWGVNRENPGQAVDETLAFTRQMAALYNKHSHNGKDLLLDIHYTDVDKYYRLVLGKEEAQVLDDSSQIAAAPCDTLIETPFSIWQSIARGELSGEEALMQHKYRVRGNFSTMLRWDEIFGPSDPTPAPAEKEARKKRTNMLLFLLPYFAAWYFLNMDALPGSAATLAVAVATPLLYLRYKGTAYEYLSIALVGGAALLRLLGLPPQYVLPITQLSFGLLWSVSAFLKTPLSAWYSCNEYGGDKAFQNPIFMRTNRILSACWGALYLLLPLLTFLLLGMEQSLVSTLLGSLLPGLMGVFTWWFQRWYPAHVAKA